MHWKPVYSWFYVCVLWLSWQIELHCYWCVLSLQDSLLYFWLGFVRLLSNWKEYMWGRKLQEEFGCVFNCHLSGALVPFAMVPEKRVLGALVEQLCFIEWLFQQHDARNFGNDLLSGFFLSLESLNRVLELVNALQVWCIPCDDALHQMSFFFQLGVLGIELQWTFLFCTQMATNWVWMLLAS